MRHRPSKNKWNEQNQQLHNGICHPKPSYGITERTSETVITMQNIAAAPSMLRCIHANVIASIFTSFVFMRTSKKMGKEIDRINHRDKMEGTSSFS